MYALIAGMCVESELRSSAAVGKEINLQAVSRATTMALAAAATATHGGSKWDAMKRDLTGNLSPRELCSRCAMSDGAPPWLSLNAVNLGATPAVAIAIRYCGIRLKPDNLTAHRSWVLAEYWDRNVRCGRAMLSRLVRFVTSDAV